jgi:probable FeS assembly SUF system protein SufT
MERVELLRECEAVQIPAGNTITLEKGVEVFITQSLGGTFTLQVPAYNGLYRIAGKDADAIGKTAAEAAATTTSSGDLEAMVWDQLKTCYDPEIPVNIVDLGLVYQCELQPLDDGKFDIKMKMTLTAPGCGMGPVLASDVKTKVESLPGVHNADIEVVFDPVWDRSMMSDAAKLQLGMMW